MANLLHRFQMLWRRLWSVSYRYPALDITLGQRHLHLVGSIHMGTRNMMPLPAVLYERLQQADALIVEADITGGASPSVKVRVVRRWLNASLQSSGHNCNAAVKS